MPIKDLGSAAPREAYGKALVELGRENPNIVVLDADLSCSTKTSLFAKEFPKRFINAGVAEQDMIGMAAGLATTGKIVFASTFSCFASGRAWEQVRVSVAYPRLNVKIVATHGGITTGEDGATHQAIEDLAIIRVIPNMTLIVPSDAVLTDKAVRAAAAYHGPVFIRLPRAGTPTVYENCDFKIGKANVLREGKDLSIFACGIMVYASLVAAEELQKENISAEVIDIHTLKPLDKEAIIKSAKKTGKVITAEEHSIIGGLGGAVAETLSENCPTRMARIGTRDMFAESGKAPDLLIKYGLTAKDIIKTAKQIL
ncbi:transketolase [candidate division WOR-1 bacterium RIFOXYA12_FULL_43_27]|uniref:Transketolase n=1 Tax=candidate division WOR-1 bacterium RIFOXYC2_FULL_46_14 TaxID=1802587 RepID=A0A1F4U5P5_UNCSA|nr:MAG: transketolase [candidate division WOR-1 bacterium RIFOXYA12_FULL_43_27]OGC20061.1 MAG: transketolase [candidate division WOR-1 bacterium RIFOXYB2_FULL_46_45]OGC32203.1 MAG: transketolase [candidate division WOR-1 bacterium RIFOXYA2_FULL_46_56]OGC39603.1 MAG: transketolase [candidate division WOR-1 bacterium RIFOXYC2_FULL_46_14]